MNVRRHQIIRHRSGTEYIVLMLTNQDTQKPDEYPVTVVYENIKTGAVWSRPLADMGRSFT